MDPATIIQIAERIAGASGATALLLVLFGSYKGWWIWGRQLTEERADYEQRCDDVREDAKRQIEDVRAERERLIVEMRAERDRIRAERDEYKTMLLRTLKVAETATSIAKTSVEG